MTFNPFAFVADLFAFWKRAMDDRRYTNEFNQGYLCAEDAIFDAGGTDIRAVKAEAFGHLDGGYDHPFNVGMRNALYDFDMLTNEELTEHGFLYVVDGDPFE